MNYTTGPPREGRPLILLPPQPIGIVAITGDIEVVPIILTPGFVNRPSFLAALVAIQILTEPFGRGTPTKVGNSQIPTVHEFGKEVGAEMLLHIP